jgi:hypothetical protein
MVHAADRSALEQFAEELGCAGWHPWQSDTGRWWATRPGRWQEPMTLGPAEDRAELAGILESAGGYRLAGQGE